MDYAKSAWSQGEIPNLQPKETKFRCAEHQIEEKKILKLLLNINPNCLSLNNLF